MKSARAFPPPYERATEHTRHGGNWPASTHAAPFLFEQPSHLGAQIQSGGRGFASFPTAPARAALIGAYRIAAKLLSPLCFPFPKINHDAHVDGSPSVGRTEVNKGGLA